MIGSPVEPVEVGSGDPVIYRGFSSSKRWLALGFLNHQLVDRFIGRKPMLRALLARYEQLLSRAPTATTGVVAAGLGVSE